MVEGFTPALGGGDAYLDVLLNPALPDEVGKILRAQAGIERQVVTAGFT